MYVKIMKIIHNMKFIYGIWYRVNWCVTSHNIVWIMHTNHMKSFFEIVATLLKFLELCTRTKNPFSK